MKFFLDTEFIENGETIDLISIGIVSEDNRELYLGNCKCQFNKASSWVRENVLSNLTGLTKNLNYLDADCDRSFWVEPPVIADKITEFVGGKLSLEPIGDRGYRRVRSVNKAIQPEFWAYYADYDWVVFCQLFGTMMDLPEGFPMYCKDIKQECDRLGNPQLPPQGSGEHNALEDAKWNKKAFEFLQNKKYP